MQTRMSDNAPENLPVYEIDVFNTDGSNNPDDRVSKRARAFLFLDDYLLDLGRPIGGQVLARGADPNSGSPSKLCVYDLSESQFGCTSVDGPEKDTIEVRRYADWQPEIRLIANSVTDLSVTVTITGTTQLPEGTPITVTIYPRGSILESRSSSGTIENNAFSSNNITFAEAVDAGYIEVKVGHSPDEELSAIESLCFGGNPWLCS